MNDLALATRKETPSPAVKATRDVIFISKATPDDDDFALWLAPRLEAAGYVVFADILCLQAGDRWRKELTETLQNRAVKMLLCCQDSTLAKNGVQEEIGIAEDLARDLSDPRFIIPRNPRVLEYPRRRPRVVRREPCRLLYGSAGTGCNEGNVAFFPRAFAPLATSGGRPLGNS